jgi:hypothetical protein
MKLLLTTVLLAASSASAAIVTETKPPSIALRTTSVKTPLTTSFPNPMASM